MQEHNVIQYFYHSYIKWPFQYISNKWHRELSIQQKLIAGVALALFTCVIWGVTIYLLHRKFKASSYSSRDIRIQHQAQYVLNSREEVNKSPITVMNFVDKDGKKYEGQFSFFGEKYSGFGTITFPNKDVWVGEFKENELEGSGKKMMSGNTYVGQFKKSHLHGDGRIEFVNGDVYEGRFESGQLKQGKKILVNGDFYEGDFDCGQLNGYGRVLLNQMKEYHVGEFKNDHLHGKGIKLSILSGWQYEGTFKNGKLHGNGEAMRYGNTYKGNFYEGFLNGPEGKVIFANGDIHEGVFFQDVLEGEGKITKIDGTVIQGRFKEGYLIS